MELIIGALEAIGWFVIICGVALIIIAIDTAAERDKDEET
jgi:hypothetical protein